jgi:pimeloyl-ACP methyl ester carboxylesterase
MESSSAKNNKRHLVFIRGLVREADHWEDSLVHSIQEGLNADLVTRLDIPGAGVHIDKKVPLSIKGIVEFMRAEFLQKNPADHDALFITISMGGMVGAEWARLYPQDMKAGLVMINSSLGGHSPIYKRLKPSAYPMVLSQPFLNLEKREYAQLKKVSNRPEIYDQIAQKWIRIQKDRPMKVASKIRQLLAATHYRPSKAKPNVSVLILVGERDRLVDPQCSYDIHKNWNVPIEAHPTAGHALGIDAPEWVSEKIISWAQTQA